MSDEIEIETNSESDRLSYTASLITQGRHKFFSLSMPSSVLSDCSYVLSREESREEGFQRYLDTKRSQEIADYIDSGLGTIPTAVILSAQSDCNLEYNSKNRTVSFDNMEKAFLIIDGQHRVYGFYLAEKSLRIPVVIYNGLEKDEEAQLFIDINTKQKPVPSELLLDIKKLAKTQGGVERKLGAVFDLFDSEPGSSLLGRLSPFERKSGLISRVTFNAALKPISHFFEGASAEQVYNVLNPFYSGSISAFERISDNIDICSPMTFRGLTAVFPDVKEKVDFKFDGDFSPKSYSKYMISILKDRKISALEGRQKSSSTITNLLLDAMKPRKIF